MGVVTGKPWTDADDMRLIQFHTTLDVGGIRSSDHWCAILSRLTGRTAGAVRERLRRLGLRPRRDMGALRTCPACHRYRADPGTRYGRTDGKPGKRKVSLCQCPTVTP